MSWLEVAIDPTALFAVSCLVAPLYMLPERPAPEQVVGYLTEPSMVAAMILLVMASAVGALLRCRLRGRRTTSCAVQKSSTRAARTTAATRRSIAASTANSATDTSGATVADGATKTKVKGGAAGLNSSVADDAAAVVGDAAEPVQVTKATASRSSAEPRVRRGLPLTYLERTRARWYLINGVVFHMLMDGCVGVFKTNALLARSYAKLDRRYAEPLGSYNGSAVHVISLVELVIKGPICVALYLAIQTRHPASDALEFFTCVTQAYGTIVYLGQEAISGAPNLDVDYDLTFSQHHLVYFWFAIFFGCTLYLIVPSILAWRSFGRIVARAAAATR